VATVSQPGIKRSASLGVIFGIVMLDLIGFGIIIPQLGVYGVKFKGSAFMVGLLLSVYSVMQFLFAPLLGRLSDKYGRRPVLLYSVAGSLVGYVLFAMAHSLEMLFLARIIHGVSGANISTAQAYVADVTTPENRARGMGLVGAAFGIGFVLGPAIGGILGGVGGNFAIGLGAAALSATNLVLAYVLLPESRWLAGAGGGHPHSPSKGRWAAILRDFKVPVTGQVLALYLLYMIAFAAMEGTFSVFVLSQHLAKGLVDTSHGLFSAKMSAHEPVLKEASTKVGYLFTAVGLVSAAIQGGLVGRLKARFGEPALAVVGMALAALGIGLIPSAPTYNWFFAPVVLLAAGSSLVNPSLSSILSVHAGGSRQGEALGTYQSMGALGRIIGPALGGFLFSVFAPGMPYWVSASLLVVCVVLALRLSSLVKAPREPAAS
jgi:multidrug resistance protein